MSPLSRRRFLQVGGALGAALAAGSALLMRGGGDGWYRGLLQGATPKVLSQKECSRCCWRSATACCPAGRRRRAR